jgi:dTDP-4-dehydrorhamnose 3,5-epimerase
MKNLSTKEGKQMALDIRDRCRRIAKDRGMNPRYWKSVYEEVARGIGLKTTTLRRLIYAAEPKIRHTTAEMMDKILHLLDGSSGREGQDAEPDAAVKGGHRTDYELIDGVMIKELRPLPDARGYLMEILRSDDVGFFGSDAPFGQVYLTCAYPGVVKAWHAHRRQADRFCCVSGNARLVLYDDRPESPTSGYVNQLILGNLAPKLVLIPAGVQHGFAALGAEPALVINIPTKTYDYNDPDELRLDPHDNHVPFDWNRVDG